MQGLFFTDHLVTCSSHLDISRLISLYYPSSPSQTQAFRLYALKKGMHHATHSVTLMEHWPSSKQWHGWWASPTTAGRVPQPLPLIHIYAQPMQRKVFTGFTICELSGNQAHYHCELPTSLRAAAAAGTEPCSGTGKQQCCSGTVIAEEGCEAFSRVKNPLLLWGLAGRTVLSLWPHSVTFSGNISPSRWDTLPNTNTPQKLLCLPLAQHPLYCMLKALFETRKQMSQVVYDSAIAEAAAIKQQLN